MLRRSCRRSPPRPGPRDPADVPASAGNGAEAAVHAPRPLGHALAVVTGFREPVVAVLLAIAFFTAVSGKPVDGVLMLIVAVSLAWDAGRRARDARERPAMTAAPGSTAAAGPAGGIPDAPIPAAAAPPPTRGAGAGPAVLTRSARRLRVLAAAVLVAAGAGYAVVVGSFSRYSWPATAGIAGLGTAVVLIGWHRPPARTRTAGPLPVAGVAVWGGLGVAGCLWELAALLKQPTLTTASYAHPTISALTDPVLASATGRVAVLMAWLALGWYLVRR
jgi:hypothetical protein